MKFICYKCEFVGKINEIHILINEKSNREIPRFFKISRDISRSKIEPGSRELNPTVNKRSLMNRTWMEPCQETSDLQYRQPTYTFYLLSETLYLKRYTPFSICFLPIRQQVSTMHDTFQQLVIYSTTYNRYSTIFCNE